MQGEYRGDFTRDTFAPAKHFSRVLMQQGRVLLDEDWNEQSSILLHYLRTLATDFGGPNWGPTQFAGGLNEGFSIAVRKEAGKEHNDFSIGRGRYYVDGLLCENDRLGAYTEQDDFRPEGELKGTNEISYLVYLDVWERHITAVHDASIREVALGGPDTSTRARVTWQVKVDDVTARNEAQENVLKMQVEARGLLNAAKDVLHSAAQQYLRVLREKLLEPANRGGLRARAKKKVKSDEPCAISPESSYRGVENHLYRVEIHKSGPAWDQQVDDDGKPVGNIERAATFKWSRDNASILFPIRSLAGNTVTLGDLGRDVSTSLQINDYVEVVDDDLTLRGESGPLRQVESIDAVEMSVTLKDGPGTLLSYNESSTNHPLLRRWDHKDDGLEQTALALKAGAGETDNTWLELEDGIQIQFATANTEPANTYRAGDYWLIPARVASGDVDWPRDVNSIAQMQLPHGIEHHYAPLWLIKIDPAGTVTADPNKDCRRLLL